MVITSFLLSFWLVASAFVLPHTPVSALFTATAGVTILAATLFGREHALARFVVTGAALALSGAVVFMRGVPDVVALNHALVAPVLFVLALAPLHPLAAREAHARPRP